MKFFKKLRKSYVYKKTNKPECYVHVDKVKTLQDERQLQYNNWCKAKRVYNGSYLPTNPNKLKEEGKKGWKEVTSIYDNTKKHRVFKRKSSGQLVRYDYKDTKNNVIIDEHYHWFNDKIGNISKKMKNKVLYKDRYGNPCAKKSRESHLAPLDKNYNHK